MRTASDISSAYVTTHDGQIENAGAVRLESRCQIGELRSAHSCVRPQSPPDELRVCDGICMDCHLIRTDWGQLHHARALHRSPWHGRGHRPERFTYVCGPYLAQRPVLCIHRRTLHRIECRVGAINHLLVPTEGAVSRRAARGRARVHTLPKMVYLPSRCGCFA